MIVDVVFFPLVFAALFFLKKQSNTKYYYYYCLTVCVQRKSRGERYFTLKAVWQAGYCSPTSHVRLHYALKTRYVLCLITYKNIITIIMFIEFIIYYIWRRS